MGKILITRIGESSGPHRKNLQYRPASGDKHGCHADFDSALIIDDDPWELAEMAGTYGFAGIHMTAMDRSAYLLEITMKDHHWKHTAKGVHEGTPLWTDQQKNMGKLSSSPQ